MGSCNALIELLCVCRCQAEGTITESFTIQLPLQLPFQDDPVCSNTVGEFLHRLLGVFKVAFFSIKILN